MDRRRFLLISIGGLGLWPAAGEAQPAGRVWRMAWLGESVDPGPANVALTPFLEGLRDLGYVEGQHFTLERRFAAGSPERLRELAGELVRLKLDLMLARERRARRRPPRNALKILGEMVPPGESEASYSVPFTALLAAS
jgi:hypothetical protein